MNINQRQFGNINEENLHRKKKLNQREMELETEIPIWFNGRVKWISNLTSRSRCSDVIEAILTSLDIHSSDKNSEYLLYESWRGVERTLKARCRLLKLWKSWAGESQNVILTLRLREEDEETIPKHILIKQQEKKLNKLKYQIKKTDQLIEKFHFSNQLNNNNNNNHHDTIVNYLNISRSIIRLNTEIENQENLILNLTLNIEKEKIEDFNPNDVKDILFDVNETLISSRKLTHLSDQLDQEINLLNENIDQKQTILDDLELDLALQENIHIDNLDDHQQEFLSFKQNSPSPPPIIPNKIFSVLNRPTAIVEPSPSTFKSKEYLSKNSSSPLLLNKFHLEDQFSKKNKMEFLPFSNSLHCHFQISSNDESDTGISSIHSNDEQLITLV